MPLLAAVGVVGIAIGWLVSHASPGNDEHLALFQRHPWYIVWSSMGAIFVALWLILDCVALWQIWPLPLVEEGSRWSHVKWIIKPALGYLFYAAIVATLTAIVVQSVRGGVTSDIPLSHPIFRAGFYTGVAVLGSMPSVAGLWMIRRRAMSLPAVASGAPAELPAGLDSFLALRSASQRFLAILSTIVATDVLHIGALRSAVVGAGVVRPEYFTPEYVLMYGAIFAVAIAIIYLPPELTLRQAGRMLQSVSVQKLETESPRTLDGEVVHWLEQVSQRARVGQALGLEVPILTRLQTSLGIFAPLLISIIAVFLPHQPH